jgi:hypothetical protein
MANNINREGFKTLLDFGVPSFEGNIILDSGELSEYYYRFMRIPLAYGEHKVDVLYGQRFYGTLEKKPVTFNQEIRFLCLVVDNAKTVNETQDFKTIFCRSSFTSDSVIEEMAQKLFDMFRENVTEEDKKKILKGGYYDKIARQNAFCRIINEHKNYRSPIDSIVDEIGNGSCFGLTSTNADELVVDYLANPTGWAERTMERIKKASLEYSGLQFWITLAMTEELTEEYVKKYSNPDTPEGKFKSLTDSIKNYKNVHLGLDVNGEIDSVKYPVDGIFNMDAMYDGYLDTWNIAPRSEEERIEEFLEENDALLKTGIRFRSSTFRISITERKRSGRIQISKTNNKKTAHNIIWWAAFLEIYATIIILSRIIPQRIIIPVTTTYFIKEMHYTNV